MSCHWEKNLERFISVQQIFDFDWIIEHSINCNQIFAKRLTFSKCKSPAQLPCHHKSSLQLANSSAPLPIYVSEWNLSAKDRVLSVFFCSLPLLFLWILLTPAIVNLADCILILALFQNRRLFRQWWYWSMWYQCNHECRHQYR